MRENPRFARKTAGLTQQAMADKLEHSANEMLNVLLEIKESGEVESSFLKWIQKFLIHLDGRCCDILCEINKKSS